MPKHHLLSFVIYFAFISSCLSQEVQNSSSADLLIYYYSGTIFKMENETLTTTGNKFETITNKLNEGHITYKTYSLPWVRALRDASKKTNTVIFDILRTKDRENKFHWIMPVETVLFKLYTRNDPKILSLSKEEIINSHHKAVCVTNSAGCSLLKEFGFSNDQIILTTSSNVSHMENLLLRGRADFMVSIETSIAENLEYLNKTPNSITAYTILHSNTTFLAASKNINSALLKRLLAIYSPSKIK